MLVDKAVQAGGGGVGGVGSGSTVISWVVDDDNSVVKYCQDNIVTIFVPGSGDSDASDDGNDDTSGGGDTTLAIVANNTLRLRIVPCEPDHLGPNYQEIIDNDEEHYDYCHEDDINIPPPLPPRQQFLKSSATLFCQTFPRRRKNLFHHLGVGIEPVLSKNNQEIFVIQKHNSGTQTQVTHRKDLEKFLGVPISKSCSTKKDLSSFLGINRTELERVVKTPNIKRDNYFESDFGDGSNMSTSTDSSSLWSSF